MSECSLPNVDIFDPVQCTKRWNQCATQQQINVYLNAEIVRTQECLQLFKTAQQGVNDILDGKIKNHETRIAALETAQAQLKQAQSDLQANFNSLNASNTQFQTDVDKTLKLYQASINAVTSVTNTLTAEQQSMWNEINALKSTIDPAKIQQAIAGYDAIMSETKALIAQNAAETDVKLKQLDTKFNTLSTDTANAISESNAQVSKRISDFTSSVSGDITAQNARISALVNSTSESISDLQKQISDNKVSSENADVELGKAIGQVRADIIAGNQAIGERISAEEQARKDGDNALKGTITANANIAAEADKATIKRIDDLKSGVDSAIAASDKRIDEIKSDVAAAIKANDDKTSAAIKASDEKLDAAIKAQDERVDGKVESLEQWTDKKLLEINNAARDYTDKRVDGLDDKLSAQIKALDVTQQADRADLEKEIAEVKTLATTDTDDRISAASEKLNTRITQVETDAANNDAALEARLKKQIADTAATQAADLTQLKETVTTQGELITASRDEATLAWENEQKARIDGDANLQSQIDALDKANDWQPAIDEAKEDAVKAAGEYTDRETAKVGDEVDALTSRVAANEKDIAELKQSDLKQWTTINNTVESQNNTQSQVDELAKKVADVDSTPISNLTIRVEDLEQAVDDLKGEMLYKPVTWVAKQNAGETAFIATAGVKLELNSAGTGVVVHYEQENQCVAYMVQGAGNYSKALTDGQSFSPSGLTIIEIFPLKSGARSGRISLFIAGKVLHTNNQQCTIQTPYGFQ